jgi:hypothetical protein
MGKKTREKQLDLDNPIRQKVRIAKALRYDGEKVWKTGDWFACAQGPRYLRCLVLMDPENSAFPYFMDRKGRWRFVAGSLRNALTDYLLELRAEKSKKAFVLDGHLAHRENENAYISVDHKWPVNNCLYIDDCYSLTVFKAGAGTKSLAFRRKQVGRAVRGCDSPTFPIVRATKFYRIESKDQFQRMRIDAASIRNWGLMLRRDSPYEAGKSGNMIYVPPLSE